MAIEDSAVLSRLLGTIKTADTAQLRKAFTAYSPVRKLRTQQLVTTSRNAGKLDDF